MRDELHVRLEIPQAVAGAIEPTTSKGALLWHSDDTLNPSRLPRDRPRLLELHAFVLVIVLAATLVQILAGHLLNLNPEVLLLPSLLDFDSPLSSI